MVCDWLLYIIYTIRLFWTLKISDFSETKRAKIKKKIFPDGANRTLHILCSRRYIIFTLSPSLSPFFSAFLATKRRIMHSCKFFSYGICDACENSESFGSISSYISIKFPFSHGYTFINWIFNFGKCPSATLTDLWISKKNWCEQFLFFWMSLKI